MRNQGRATKDRMEHVRLGYNYRLDEMSAAMGAAQIERLPALLSNRSQVADYYAEALTPIAGDIVCPKQQPGTQRSWFVYVVQLNPTFTEEARDLTLKLLRENGIGCAPYFPSIHLQPFYKDQFGFKKGDFPICESISDRSIALPFYPALQREEVHFVADTLKKILPQLPKKGKTLQIQ